jgi:hypothetical protein
MEFAPFLAGEVIFDGNHPTRPAPFIRVDIEK